MLYRQLCKKGISPMKNKKSIFKAAAALLLASYIFSIPFSTSANSEQLHEDSYFPEGEIQAELEESRRVASRFHELFFGKDEDSDEDDTLLCPGGCAFGVKISGAGVRVALTADGKSSPLIKDDRILKINGKEITSVEDLKTVLQRSGGEKVSLYIERDGKRHTVNVLPELVGNEYQLGVILSDGAAGIGTITYIDPESGVFGGLGHGICDTESGEVLSMTQGEVTGVILGGADKGIAGKPGELRGVLTDKHLGTIDCNTRCGVFGRLTESAVGTTCIHAPIKIAHRDEVTEGDATIISTVKNGKCAEYSITIENIDYDSTGTKSFKIKVTDPTLIALTGGIVRGMSGSPIIQNGKLVGAVTHVMVADPTEGYGIFIENMLSAAQNQVQPKAA